MEPKVYAIATMDTKGAEIAFVIQQLIKAGVKVTSVDVGTQGPPLGDAVVSRQVVAGYHPDGSAAVLGQTDRGAAVEAMARHSSSFCSGNGEPDGWQGSWESEAAGARH